MTRSPEQAEISISDRARLRGFLIASLMAALYGLVGILYLLIPPVDPGTQYAFAAFITAAALVSVGGAFKIVPDNLIHPLYLLGSLCSIAFALAFISLSQDPEQTIILVITILGAASIFMSTWATSAMLLIAAAGWLFVAYDFPPPRFTHWLINLIFSSLLGFLITWRRVLLIGMIERERQKAIEAHSLERSFAR